MEGRLSRPLGETIIFRYIDTPKGFRIGSFCQPKYRQRIVVLQSGLIIRSHAIVTYKNFSASQFVPGVEARKTKCFLPK